MSLSGGKKIVLLALCILAGMQAAFAGMVTYRIHFYSPWKDNPKRNAPPAHINMEGSGGPIAFHGPAMTSEGGDWYYQDVTFNDGPPGTGDGYRNFTFHNYIPGNDNWGSDTVYNNGGKDFTLDDVFFKTGFKNNVWIIPQGPGVPPRITDIPPNTKVVYLFNPWPALGAPMIKTDKADWTNMRFPEDKTRCGWYVFYMQNGDTKVQFKNLQGGELYGVAGLKDATPYDLAEVIKADDKDTAFIVPSPLPDGPGKVTDFFPNVLGLCKFDLAVTIHDWSAASNDFEEARDGKEDGVKGTKNMVLPALGADKKPKKNPASTYPFSHNLDNWFTTDSITADPNKKNYQSCYDLPISKSMDGYWQYSSLEEYTTGFFPLGDPLKSRFPADPAHVNCYTTDIDAKSCMGAPADRPDAVKNQNFNFCMEMHANFKYEKGQKFNFIGDDDVWVFINNKLVIDIGGAHWPIKDSVNLDTVSGLTAGNRYDFDLFYCERQFSGSNLLIKTSIYFEQKQSVTAEPVAGSNPPKWDIKENTCGDKSCGAVLSSSDTCKVIPGISTFKLQGGSITTPQILPAGVSHGGITIDAGRTQVTIDTAKITDLNPGIYRVFYTSDKSGKGGYIEFEITGSYVVDFVSKIGPDALVNTPVGATVRATLNGKPDPAGQTFTLTPAAGLLVFEDSAMTRPVTAATVLTTDATGTKKVWVTSAAKGPYTVSVKGTKAKSADTFTAGFFEIVKAAAPTADPPGRTFSTPITVALATATPGATILYTVDGTPPDSARSTPATLVYTGAPINLTASLTIKAIAVKAGYYKSDIMTQSYVYARPANVKKAYYRDLDGDGRIETAIVEYDADLAAVPEKLSFKVGAPADQELTARNDQKEIAFAAGSRSRIVATFSKPFPFGVTSVADPARSGHQYDQADIPLLDGAFPVDDSVPPVIVSAVVKAPDSLQPYVKVIATFSETVTLPPTSQTALVFKRDGAEMAAGEVKFTAIRSNGGPIFEFDVDSTSAKFPIVGDYVAINTTGEISDAGRNAPSAKAFMILTGDVPKGKAATVYVTFANGTKKAGDGLPTGSEPNTPPEVVFIPFDKAGIALDGDRKDGKCPGCFVGTEGRFIGTVVYLEIPGPVEYEFKIFSNMGAFVVGGKGRITEKDIASLTPIHNGTGYLARIVWTGRTAGGEKAGTGAYVLLSTVKTQKNLRTGAPPATDTDRIRFGLLRNYRGG
jgi:fibro-slime domain-containing protein